MSSRLIVMMGLSFLTIFAGCGSKDISSKRATSVYSGVLNFKPDIENISDIIGMNKDGVIYELGSDYEIVQTGAEGAYEGYNFKAYGMTFVFEDADDKIAWIECDGTVDIKGAKAGMNFAQVQEKLGKTKINDTWYETPENKAYELVYVIKNCRVEFVSSKEDGSDSWLTVYKKDRFKGDGQYANDTGYSKENAERVKVYEVIEDLDMDGKGERIVSDLEKGKTGDSQRVYSRILVFDGHNKPVFNSEEFIDDLYGCFLEGSKTDLVRVSDLDGNGVKEIYFSDCSSSEVQNLGIVEKYEGNYRLLFFQPLADYNYKDFNGDGMLELYGRTRNAQFLCWSGRDTVYCRSKDRFVPSYSCTRRLWEERCRDSKKAFENRPDMDTFGELLTGYAVMGYKDKGLEIINNSRILGRYESKEDWTVRFEECLKAENAWLNSL
ncbi:MAG: hypothetical protein AB1510_09675 [Bacillota bacterium]